MSQSVSLSAHSHCQALARALDHRSHRAAQPPGSCSLWDSEVRMMLQHLPENMWQVPCDHLKQSTAGCQREVNQDVPSIRAWSYRLDRRTATVGDIRGWEGISLSMDRLPRFEVQLCSCLAGYCWAISLTSLSLSFLLCTCSAVCGTCGCFRKCTTVIHESHLYPTATLGDIMERKYWDFFPKAPNPYV